MVIKSDIKKMIEIIENKTKEILNKYENMEPIDVLDIITLGSYLSLLKMEVSKK